MNQKDRKPKSIREAVQDSELSQAEIVRRLRDEGFVKMENSHLSKIINGMIPAIDLGLAIARILEIPAQRIVWGRPEREAAT